LRWQSSQKCVVPQQNQDATEQQNLHFHSIASVPCFGHEFCVCVCVCVGARARAQTVYRLRLMFRALSLALARSLALAGVHACLCIPVYGMCLYVGVCVRATGVKYPHKSQPGLNTHTNHFHYIQIQIKIHPSDSHHNRSPESPPPHKEGKKNTWPIQEHPLGIISYRTNYLSSPPTDTQKKNEKEQK